MKKISCARYFGKELVVAVGHMVNACFRLRRREDFSRQKKKKKQEMGKTRKERDSRRGNVEKIVVGFILAPSES